MFAFSGFSLLFIVFTFSTLILLVESFDL